MRKVWIFSLFLFISIYRYCHLFNITISYIVLLIFFHLYKSLWHSLEIKYLMMCQMPSLDPCFNSNPLQCDLKLTPCCQFYLHIFYTSCIILGIWQAPLGSIQDLIASQTLTNTELLEPINFSVPHIQSFLETSQNLPGSSLLSRF